MISKTIIHTFKECKGEGDKTQSKRNGGIQIVVILTIKEVSYLVDGLFDKLVGPFCIYICDMNLCFNSAIAKKVAMPFSKVTQSIPVSAY